MTTKAQGKTNWLFWVIIGVPVLLIDFGVTFTQIVLGLSVLAILLFLFPVYVVRCLQFALKAQGKQKKGKESATYIILYLFLIRYISVRRTVMSKLTNVYPFSLLYRKRLIHARNQPLYTLIHDMETYAKRNKLPFLVQSGDIDNSFTTLYAVQKQQLGKKDFLRRIEKLLQKKYETVYVRERKDGFRILVPTVMIR